MQDNFDIIQNIWRTSPARFAEYISNKKFVRYPHINFLDQIITKEIAKGSARIVISVPPRHGKSHYTSLYLPAWFLSVFPEKNVILTSYESSFAASWGRQVRNLMLEHSQKTEVKLSDDSLASDRWETSEGGGMITAGVGGPITGRGGHLIICDDPVKNWEEALSETYRRKTIDWFNSTLYTRCEPGASIIVLMTRWHENDLAGYLTSEHGDNWTYIRLPAIAEDNDPIGRIEGTPLCSERYDLKSLESIRHAVGSRIWNALYQQSPAPDEGNLIKSQWWRFWSVLPDSFDEVIQSWDLSFSGGQNSDFVVGQVWGKKGANKYLIDQVRARMDFPQTIEAFKKLTEKYPNAHRKIVEEKANGSALIATLKSEIAGIIPFNPQGSKESRVVSISPEIESGNVYLPNQSNQKWVEEFLIECSQFPNGKNDDSVDAMAMALQHFRTKKVGKFTEDMIPATKETFLDLAW